MMGPFLIMDKSTFQGLSFECITFITRFYQHRLSPILLREITSNLAKGNSEGSNVEFRKKVAELAKKAQFSQASVLIGANRMARMELLSGPPIPMNGYQAPREGVIEINTPETGRGFFFDEHPMVGVLRNWADGNFSETDLLTAQSVRNEDSSVSLMSLYQNAEKGPIAPTFKSLEEAVAWFDEVRLLATPRNRILRVARHLFANHPGYVGMVMWRWRRAGRPALENFAPYAEYYVRVVMIYHYGFLCDFIKRGKKSKAHLDMQYIYYLPFCNVFSSDDKDLIKLVEFFLQPDQEFVSKADLQKDLKRLAAYFADMSEEQKAAFYAEYNHYPPDLEGSFTAKMWKRFMRPRQKQEGKESRPSPEKEAEIMKEFRAIQKAVEKQQSQNLSQQQGKNGQGTNSTIYL